VRVVTAGVDVQADRLEISIWGWGDGETGYLLDHKVLDGDPTGARVWQQLDSILSARIGDLRIAATAIDSGGSATQHVYQFCAPRYNLRVYAIKGQAGARAVWPAKATRNNKAKCRLFMVGVDSAKETVFSRLRIDPSEPASLHFPDGTSDEYFKQLVSEKCVTRYTRGYPHRVWMKRDGARNEALDCLVYAYAALISLNVRDWKRIERPAIKKTTPAPVPEVEPETEPVITKPKTQKPMRRPPRRNSNSWITRL
jgi:phage terminase large subunit GpA-like protein